MALRCRRGSLVVLLALVLLVADLPCARGSLFGKKDAAQKPLAAKKVVAKSGADHGIHCVCSVHTVESSYLFPAPSPIFDADPRAVTD